MKTKRITFNQLKRSILKEELEWRKQIELEQGEGKIYINKVLQETKVQFKEIENINDLIGYLEMEGFDTDEACNIIFKHSIDMLPKP